MKFFALFALLPAVLAFPSPAPVAEAYNPFPPPPQIISAHSNNPISHGALNDRNLLSSAHSSAQEAMVMDGQKAHMAKRTIKKLRKVKRQNASCKPRDEASTTVTATGTSTATGASSSVTKSATSTGPGAGTVRPTTSPKASASATTTTKTSAAAPAKTNFTVDPDGNGPFKGQATYYDTDVGYGSCGTWHKNWQPTVALSRELMDNWPGYNGLNPNNNPICGQRLQLNYQGKTLIAEVQDTCPSCTKRWIDVSQGIFEYFAATSVGMLGIDGYTPGFTWQWVDRNTPLTVLPH